MKFYLILICLLLYPGSKSCEPTRHPRVWTEFLWEEIKELGSGENKDLENLRSDNATLSDDLIYSEEELIDPEELDEDISSVFACQYVLKYKYMKSLYSAMERQMGNESRKNEGVCIQGLRAYSFFRNDHIMCFDHDTILSIRNLTYVHLMLPINNVNNSLNAESYVINVLPKSFPLDNSTSFSRFPPFQKSFNLTKPERSTLLYEFIDITRILKFWIDTSPWACLAVHVLPSRLYSDHVKSKYPNESSLKMDTFNILPTAGIPNKNEIYLGENLSVKSDALILNQTLLIKKLMYNFQPEENFFLNKITKNEAIINKIKFEKLSQKETQNNLIMKDLTSNVSHQNDSVSSNHHLHYVHSLFHLKHKYGDGPHLVLFVGLTSNQIESLLKLDSNEEINDILLWTKNSQFLQNINDSSPDFNRP